MAYSGKYKVKNIKKYKGDPYNVIYRSMWEKHVFTWLDNNPKVSGWSSEETVIPYVYDVDGKYHRYFVDVKVQYEDKRTVLIEIKPEKETSPPVGKRRTRQYVAESLTYIKNMNKWEAADKFAKDRGWEFQVWTETTLRELGILPKAQPGKLKQLKPLKPYRKKPKK